MIKMLHHTDDDLRYVKLNVTSKVASGFGGLEVSVLAVGL